MMADIQVGTLDCETGTEVTGSRLRTGTPQLTEKLFARHGSGSVAIPNQAVVVTAGRPASLDHLEEST
jgi:hypothetical protein